MFEYKLTASSAAGVETVWDILVDSLRWPDWTRLPTPTMERDGDPKPFGLGAIRCFRFGPLTAKEEVVLWEPPRRYGYTVRWISLRGYRAEVTLEPEDGGTAISWCGRFERSTVPGLSRPFLWFIRTALARIATNLARHAERGVVRTD